MSIATEHWKKWEGRIVGGRFALRQWLGGSDHSAVFLTARSGKDSQKAAIKLIPVENSDPENAGAEAQLSRWAEAAKLSHPNLLRIFEFGRYEIDQTQFLYVVMEFADENLAEILPLRPLTPAEATEMLRPAAEALAAIHRAGFTHGRIKPSNILAVDNNLKISIDALGKHGDRSRVRAFSPYDAPELKSAGTSPAGDIWSLGVTLVAVLTQHEPKLNAGTAGTVTVPGAIPQPLREIAQQSLQVDPKQRGTAADILSRLRGPAQQAASPRKIEASVADVPRVHSKRRMLWPIMAGAVLVLVLLVLKFAGHQPAVPAAETPAATPPAVAPQTQSPAPFSNNKKPAPNGVVRGSVLQQVVPDVSRSARNTITGRIKVSVQVSVNSSGSVTQARLTSPGPSRYFANQALTAARRWKFNPPQVDGVAVASEWVLRFQFARASTQVFPSETKP
jgi:eukaryotic-like serine/threonine-protein kinase